MYDKLAKIALQMRSKAYAPYSHFTVGVALLCDSGEIYTGTNIENVSYGATICAERIALSTAIMEGEKKFVAIAIAGAKEGEKALKPCNPCGMCVQVMSEFFDKHTHIVLATESGYEVHDFVEIAPLAFDKGSI